MIDGKIDGRFPGIDVPKNLCFFAPLRVFLI